MARAKRQPEAPEEPRWSASGFARLGRGFGAPLLFHWSIPLGLYVLDGMRVLPGYWVAGTLLILAHELGHAWLARRYGATVTAVKVMPIGGLCEYRGDLTEAQRSVVAWGGVLAQALIYALTAAALRALGAPHHPWLADAARAWTQGNAFLIALNLMPVRPLDGYEAWRLPLRWLQAGMQRVENEKIRRQTAALRERRPPADAVPPIAAKPGAPRHTPKTPEASDATPVSPEAEALAAKIWDEARRDP